MSKKHYLLNFGPQHPAAHGVLRLIIELNSEVVQNCDPHIGLLHRGTEKLLEYKNYFQALPYYDRLDYVSMMSQEHAYSLAVENLFNNAYKANGLPEVTIPKRASYIRVIFIEITRILNHLLAITTHAMDLGALSPFLWAFEEREKLIEFYERTSGARMHAAYIRPGGVALDIPNGLLKEIYYFISQFGSKLDDIQEILCGNRIFRDRTQNIGIVPYDIIKDYTMTGVMSRGTGLPYDLRIHEPYENYHEYDFLIAVGTIGDCYDRFLVRMKEMRESCKIIEQACNQITEGPIWISFAKYNNPARGNVKNFMESLIQHFKFFANGISTPESMCYTAVEAPKGEFGTFLTAYNNSSKPYRCYMRAPGFYHLAAMNRIGKSASLADVVALIGTLDIVFGEVDR